MNRQGLRARKLISRRILKTWGELNIGHKHAMMLGNDRNVCSCYACGNPRKWFKQKHRQEVLADERAKEWY